MTTEEFYAKYKIGKLQEKNVVTDFDCGDKDLNDFILNEVMLYKEQLLALPYILVEQEKPNTVVAYFTLANDKIAISDFASNSQFNKFKKKNFSREKYLRSYPSTKIGRLGIATAKQGLGLGTYLLRFIKMYFLQDNKTGCRFITVDAYNDAVAFYQKNGFEFLEAEDEQPTQLMFFDLMTIRRPVQPDCPSGL